MVIDCFVKGNLEGIVNYIDVKLVKNFQTAIDCNHSWVNSEIIILFCEN